MFMCQVLFLCIKQCYFLINFCKINSGYCAARVLYCDGDGNYYLKRGGENFSIIIVHLQVDYIGRRDERISDGSQVIII